jgi:hypothetical protein
MFVQRALAQRCARGELTDFRFPGSNGGVRIEVVTVHESWSDEKPTYRLCETDGSVCVNWRPGLEPNDPEGPLDRGGFEQRLDATAFALGVDHERSLFGLIAESVEEIDRERAQLDDVRTINAANRRKTLDDLASAALDRMDDAPQLDFGAHLEAVSEPAAPVVEHRRRRVA